MKKQGLHLKSVELWFHIIIWCHPIWRHTGRAASSPSDAMRIAVASLGWALSFNIIKDSLIKDSFKSQN